MELLESQFGENARLFSLINDHGARLDVTDFGARIVNLMVPTSTGERNIVLGFDSPEAYVAQDPFIGASIGRVAGRIRLGQFEIDGKSYQVQTDPQTGHTLHGGSPSFDTQVWQSSSFQTADAVGVKFTLLSPTGENGFPGNLTASVTYTFNNDNEWALLYQAQSDEPTLYNPTNHVYFNLMGDVTTPIDQHVLTLVSDEFAVLNEDVTVTGEKRHVSGTAFDFSTPKTLANCFEFSDDAQKDLFSGMDHPFFLTHAGDVDAILESPDGAVRVEMVTDQDTVVVFTANFGDGGRVMGGKNLVNHGGITLEAQAAPGAVEFADFGDIVLRPEQTYQAKTTYRIIV